MPLNKALLKTNIEAAFKAQQSKEDNPDAALSDIADKIATAIDSYIKQITVTSVPVLIAPPGGGAVTGTITNTVS